MDVKHHVYFAPMCLCAEAHSNSMQASWSPCVTKWDLERFFSSSSDLLYIPIYFRSMYQIQHSVKQTAEQKTFPPEMSLHFLCMLFLFLSFSMLFSFPLCFYFYFLFFPSVFVCLFVFSFFFLLLFFLVGNPLFLSVWLVCLLLSINAVFPLLL